MDTTDRRPLIVRLTRRLEEASVLDGPVRHARHHGGEDRLEGQVRLRRGQEGGGVAREVNGEAGAGHGRRLGGADPTGTTGFRADPYAP